MKKIRVLDCTLRDGGYCNQWEFGFDNAKRIIGGLADANIDIIECGFLTNRVTYNRDITKFNSLEQIQEILPANRGNKPIVCMMNYGEYDIETLPSCDRSGITGIRVAFHKRDLLEALDTCSKIRSKGYDVYVQAMVSLSYSEKEFIDLILRCNDIMPKAFYIVDSFGAMKKHQLMHLFRLVEQYLAPNIELGFHCHNNMQMAYSNAQTFIAMDSERMRIVDSSVYGMGRGAGNLNTELFVEHLNDLLGKTYDIGPLLKLIDEILNLFYQRSYWGYSLAYYLSAKHNLHPNYASYFDDKKTLTIGDMDTIFAMMDDAHKVSYSKEYAESLYLKYMDQSAVQSQHSEDMKRCIGGKTVLVIAPGRTAEQEKDKICTFAANANVVTISVNYNYPHTNTDYVFVSNLRRFQDLDRAVYNKTITTSNINADDVYLRTSYSALLNNVEPVQDNAGIMLIQFLINLGAERIVLAGMDGYYHDDEKNYAQQNMTYITRNEVLDSMNSGMKTMIKRFSAQTKIEFLTATRLEQD